VGSVKNTLMAAGMPSFGVMVFSYDMKTKQIKAMAHNRAQELQSTYNVVIMSIIVVDTKLAYCLHYIRDDLLRLPLIRLPAPGMPLHNMSETLFIVIVCAHESGRSSRLNMSILYHSDLTHLHNHAHVIDHIADEAPIQCRTMSVSWM
jgi:hypothetical protein